MTGEGKTNLAAHVVGEGKASSRISRLLQAHLHSGVLLSTLNVDPRYR